MIHDKKVKLRNLLIEHKCIASSDYEDENPLVGVYFDSLCEIIDQINNNEL